MGLDESFETYDLAEWAPVLIVYAVLVTISVIVFRKIYTRYKNLPDKTVEAILIKKSRYYGSGETNDGLPSSARYIIAKYEYYINGIRHTVKTQCFGSVPDTILLFYKKGNSDIRGEKEFSLPGKYKVLMAIWFTAGIALITIGLSWVLGFEVIRKMFV